MDIGSILTWITCITLTASDTDSWSDLTGTIGV